MTGSGWKASEAFLMMIADKDLSRFDGKTAFMRVNGEVRCRFKLIKDGVTLCSSVPLPVVVENSVPKIYIHTMGQPDGPALTLPIDPIDGAGTYTIEFKSQVLVTPE